MKIALFADSFPPMHTAAAIQLDHLATELSNHSTVQELIVVVPEYSWKHGEIKVSISGNLKIIRFGYPDIKNKNVIYRFLGEFCLQFFMLYSLVKVGKYYTKFDRVIIYSPSIFIWPIFLLVRGKKQVRRILILRDMFPQWAYHTGFIKNIVVYKFLLWFSYGQFFLSDKIFIQAPGDRKYFDCFWKFTKIRKKVQVLNNWLRNDDVIEPVSNPSLSESLERYKTIVYAGNIGPTQGIDVLIKLAIVVNTTIDYRFLVFGRGYYFNQLSAAIESNSLKNTIIFDEIPLPEIRSVYRRSQIGVVSLNAQHQSNNIPGKFVAYLRDGLPILSFGNQTSDLCDIVNANRLGVNHSVDVMPDQLLKSIKDMTKSHKKNSNNCHRYFESEFDVKRTIPALLELT
jgi:hypothetical protein